MFALPPMHHPANTASRLPRSAGVVVLPVQDITWLQAEVVIDKTTIEISSGRTDYIFVTKAAWARCQEEYGAKLQGRTLKVDAGHTPSEALHSMLGSICGLYEAKSPASMLHDGVPKVRAQAVLEYVVINQMAEWPEGEHQLMHSTCKWLHRLHGQRMWLHRFAHCGQTRPRPDVGVFSVLSPIPTVCSTQTTWSCCLATSTRTTRCTLAATTLTATPRGPCMWRALPAFKMRRKAPLPRLRTAIRPA